MGVAQELGAILCAEAARLEQGDGLSLRDFVAVRKRLRQQVKVGCAPHKLRSNGRPGSAGRIAGRREGFVQPVDYW